MGSRGRRRLGSRLLTGPDSIYHGVRIHVAVVLNRLCFGTHALPPRAGLQRIYADTIADLEYSHRRWAIFVWAGLRAGLGIDVVVLREAEKVPEGEGTACGQVPRARWGSAVITTIGSIRPVALPGYEGWLVSGTVESNNRLPAVPPAPIFAAPPA